MEDLQKLEDDIFEIAQAVDSFLRYQSDSQNEQAKHLILMLRQLKVEGVLKTPSEYKEYYTPKID